MCKMQLSVKNFNETLPNAQFNITIKSPGFKVENQYFTNLESNNFYDNALNLICEK